MKQVNNNKKAYLAPMVEVMSARVEKGFAGSKPADPHAPISGGELEPYTPTDGEGNINATDLFD